jgi:hypothetical protein
MDEVVENHSDGIRSDLALVGCFLIFGASSGFLFALLITRPALHDFFFIELDKFVIPRYSYWIAFSLLQLLGLAAAYFICRRRGWIFQPLTPNRLLIVSLIIGLATPLLRLGAVALHSRIGWEGELFAAPAMFLVLLSVALCIVAGGLRLLPVAIGWNLLFAIAGFVLVYAVLRITNVGKEWYEFIQWPILKAMLALSFGNWLIWRQRITMMPKLIMHSPASG